MAKTNDPKKQAKTNNSQTSKDWLQYDEYWLLKGREIINNTVTTLEKRLKTLNTFLNYLAAGTFFGGISFSTYVESKNIAVYILIVIPLLSIAYAKYEVGIKGGQVINESTDMRSPNQINKEYNGILTKLIKQVKEATLTVGIATGFTLACLPFAVYFHNSQKSIQAEGEYFAIQYDSKTLKVTGNEPKMKNLNIILFGKTPKNKVRIPIQREILLESPERFSTTFDLENIKIKLDSVELYYLLDEQKVKSTYRYYKNSPPIRPEKNQNNKPAKDSITKKE